MKKPLSYLSLAVLVAAGIVSLVWFALGHWQPRTITEITQQRGLRFGNWPVYKVILRAHQSTYIGKSGTTMIGTYTSGDVDYSDCVRSVRKSAFFSLWWYYTEFVTDRSTMTISVAYSGGHKTVSAYGGAGPKRLSDLEDQIDQAVAKAHWHKVSSSTDYPSDN